MASFVLVWTYLLAELWAGNPPATATLTNLFFLMTANVIGMVGAWISEYRHRAHFLDRQLLDLLHQSARDESRRKTELITAASHDLRQPPLNVIDLALETLQPESEHSEVMNQLRDTVGQLRNLLGGTVFDSARLNEGMIQPELQPVQLNHTLQELEDLLSDTLSRRDIRLDIAPPAEPGLALSADPSLLLRVLQNLVINAANHSGGQRIQVNTVTTGNWARIRVCDDGRGLPESLHTQVFDPPYIRAGASHQAGGLGLGLTIVREFSRLMGGQCGTESSSGRGGAVFWVALPVAVTTSPGPGPGSRIQSDCAPPPVG